MFTNKKKQYYSNLLGFKNVDDFENFAKRYLKYLENIKNQHIKKYSTLILDLRKNGSGSQSIVKYLFENHRVKVSRGTIEKFYKQNNL